MLGIEPKNVCMIGKQARALPLSYTPNPRLASCIYKQV
jgi:hypothetical protein